jgi:hypothetical protein
MYGSISKLIGELRANHLAEGGDPKDFPEYLKQSGVQMMGPIILIEDSFVTMAELKYAL